jgi:hypothetical protein
MTELPASQRLDLRKVDIGDVLSRVENALQLEMAPDGVIKKRRSIGFRSDRNTWVRVECRGLERLDGQAWGLEAAQILDRVPLPRWHAGVSWLDDAREVMWRADETQLVDEAPIDKPTNAEGLPGQWWDALSAALDELASHETSRVATPDCAPISVDRIETTIRKAFPECTNIVIDEWSTAHADLNWANLTGPALWILDWEDWGRAPRGLDAANLWFGSLAVPEVAAKVYRGRHQDLDSRAGKVMQLFKCAELLAWADDSEPLYAPAQHEANRLQKLLSERA